MRTITTTFKVMSEDWHIPRTVKITGNRIEVLVWPVYHIACDECFGHYRDIIGAIKWSDTRWDETVTCDGNFIVIETESLPENIEGFLSDCFGMQIREVD